MDADKYKFIETELNRRRIGDQLRSLRALTPLAGAQVNADGRRMLNFCSNDYLGLAKHTLLQQRAIEFMRNYGAGSTASRLICGTIQCFEDVEEKLSSLKETESSLIFNSGFQANVSILPALTNRQSLILSDSLNHNSIIQGALLSRCRVKRFRHNDLQHLRQLLKQHRQKGAQRILIVTESVFSMDGDRSDIRSLVDLAQEFEALLIIDEAHATGVLGPRGMGLTCGAQVDLTIGTFGKACGSFGAYIACSKKMRDYLINCCSGFIYTTALPPAVVGSIDAALDLIPTMDKQRRKLHQNADFLRSSLNKLGLSTGNSSTQIIPVIIGGEKETVALSKWLADNGILATAIRPPTVEPGRSRIRITLSALHTRKQVEQLIRIFKKWRDHQR
jgi:8-amino-7-oxononanoate synthase